MWRNRTYHNLRLLVQTATICNYKKNNIENLYRYLYSGFKPDTFHGFQELFHWFPVFVACFVMSYAHECLKVHPNTNCVTIPVMWEAKSGRQEASVTCDGDVFPRVHNSMQYVASAASGSSSHVQLFLISIARAFCYLYATTSVYRQLHYTNGRVGFTFKCTSAPMLLLVSNFELRFSNTQKT